MLRLGDYKALLQGLGLGRTSKPGPFISQLQTSSTTPACPESARRRHHAGRLATSCAARCQRSATIARDGRYETTVFSILIVSVGERESLRRYELPPGCEIFDLLELEDCGLAFANDCGSFALLGQQHHRPCHRRSQFHSAVIFQCNKLFGVYCHWYTPTLTAGLEASAHAPNAHSKSKPSVVNACLPDVSRMGFATLRALVSVEA